MSDRATAEHTGQQTRDALPVEAQRLVELTLGAARLRGPDAARVRRELEDHFLDGIDAGVPIDRLIERFGRPELTGRLIGEAKGSGPGWVATALMHASAVAALVYIAAVVGLHARPASSSASALEREAREVAELALLAESLLESREGVRESFAIAERLRGRGSLWSETASLLLLERAMIAGDSLLSSSERAELRERLRAIGGRHGFAPRADVLSTLPRVVERVHGETGRPDREGLRLLQRTKGVARPSAGAVLVEPLYFARAVDREELRVALEGRVAERWRVAGEAGERLAGRAGAM